MSAAGTLLIASAFGPPPLIVSLLFAGEAALGFALPFYNVNQLSLRQSLTPQRLQARVAASSRTLTWAVLPVGAVIGAMLGVHLGLRGTLVISGVGTLCTAVVAYVGVELASRRPAGRLKA
jgi:hypothetical protein